MSITAAAVVFLMIWFLCLFVALPIRVETQGEAGRVVPGTPSSAPVDPLLRKKFFWVTVVTLILWAAVVYVVAFSSVTMQDVDLWGWF